MDTDKYLEEIEKVNSKIEVLNKKLATHEKQLEKLKSKRGFELDYRVTMKESHIENTQQKINYEKSRLDKLNERYKLEVAKEDLIIKESPKILIAFMDEWKKLSFDWHVHKYNEHIAFCKNLRKEQIEAVIECIETSKEYSEYVDGNGKAIKRHVENYGNIFPRSVMNEFLESRKLDYRSVNARIFNSATDKIHRMKDFETEKERLEWLDKILEKERKAKLLDLFNRIFKVTGKIIDATDLKINEKRNLDGIVKGELANVKVETIGAGGFNIQCFHFRTLVKKIK